jgi:hypothetical protein
VIFSIRMEASTANVLFGAIASYVAEHDSFLTKTKLLKLLYLLDVEYYRIHRQTFTGFKWKFFHLGPWAAEFEVLLNEAVLSGALYERYGKHETPFLKAPAFVDPSRVFSGVKDELILRSMLSTWGTADTNQILDEVYFGTDPMLKGIRNEPLDFSVIHPDRPPLYKRTSSDTDPRKIARLRAQYHGDHPSAGAQRLTPPPNYDEAYESAITALDSDEDY